MLTSREEYRQVLLVVILLPQLLLDLIHLNCVLLLDFRYIIRDSFLPNEISLSNMYSDERLRRRSEDGGEEFVDNRLNSIVEAKVLSNSQPGLSVWMKLFDGVGLVDLAVFEVERLDVEGVLEAEDVLRRVRRRFEAVREELVSSLRCEPFGTVPDRE